MKPLNKTTAVMGREKRTVLEMVVISVVVLLLSAGTYWRNKVWNNQIDLQIDSIRKSPKKARPYTNLTYAYINAGIYDKALETGQKALQLDPKAAYAYYNLSIAYQKTGDLDKAIAMAGKAIDLDPHLHMVHYSLGGIYFENGQYEKAAEEFRKILSLFPYLPNGHHLLGVTYAAQRKFDQAVAEFEREVKIDHSHTLAHLNLGQIYWYELKNREKALYHLKTALMLDPLLPDRGQIRRLVRMIEGAS